MLWRLFSVIKFWKKGGSVDPAAPVRRPCLCDGALNTPETIRGPIKNQVADYIRAKICSGEYAAGSRLVPSSIAEELNIGRGVVREALFKLEADGLVENHAYRGSFVVHMSPADLIEICSLRTLLEIYAMDHLPAEITEEDLDTLSALCDEMDTAFSHRQMENLVNLDWQFHSYFVSKATVNMLFSAWDIPSARMAALFLLAYDNGCPPGQSGANHREVIDALRISRECYKDAITQHYLRTIKHLSQLES